MMEIKFVCLECHKNSEIFSVNNSKEIYEMVQWLVENGTPICEKCDNDMELEDLDSK